MIVFERSYQRYQTLLQAGSNSCKDARAEV
jgi:hypothetical protein